ncbi:uncharacterized protein C4orf17 homolog isoform X2 [Notamacropus eugenii]|uniref:uncharacterized protein C4orf17 homolog isoform X2 n=1 Tax=Notamacropus eugenii TaxID=9315 RepID=UPI003B66BDC7
MNINFKSQPDPLIGHETSSVSRNANCFLVRHTPHPRRVCHIKEPCKQIKTFREDHCEGVLKIKKEELRGRGHISNPKANQVPVVSEHINPEREVRGKTICIPNYLDQEINILSKLCEILQTDSLAELLKWLLHASVKEKEWVSALIHSELSEINLLKNREHTPQKRSGKEKEKSSSAVKARAKEEVPKVNRVPSQKLEKNKEPRQEAEDKSGLTKERDKLEEAIAKYFSKTKPPAKNLKIWERNYCPHSVAKSMGKRNQQGNSQPMFPKTH